MNARALAKEVLKKYWDKRLPVDPLALARALKARVIEDQYLDHLSGQYSLEADGPTIRFNPNEPQVRQRFTVAHELGHYVLGHGDLFRDPTKNFTAAQFDPKEAAANRFAAEILMPESAVSELIEEHGISEISELAKLFQVSEMAMKYRLQNLDWVP